MTIAMLSWGQHKTLRATLTSYRVFGLDQMDEEKIILFQEITEQDREVAEEFGYKAYGEPTNIGIAEGYKKLVAYATGDLFLFLESDWLLLDDPHNQIYDAAELLRYEVIDVARFRSREYPGNPLYTRQFQGRELDQPTHLLDAVHWSDPTHISPNVWKTEGSYMSWFTARATHANWTNNPTMFRTEWLRENIVPRMGSRDVEIDLQSWWEQQHYVVAQSEGLFTHSRIG